MRAHWALAAGLAILAPAATNAQESPAADTRRVAIDTVVGWQDYPGATPPLPAQYVVDTFMSAALRPSIQVSFRPKIWRARGEWLGLVDQLSAQYEFRRGVNWRVEAGRFPSPVGLGMTENRPDVNAGMIWWHRAYYTPLPSLDRTAPRVSLTSAVYPSGVLVSTSSAGWDARAAVVDLAPVQFWKAQPMSARGTNVLVGGGVTPRQGLRIGASAARGPYEKAGAATPARDYVVVNVEGEYAVAYTKLSGEWVRATFDTAAGARRAHGWTLQAQQTLTPRLFAHSRVSWLASPETSAATKYTPVRRTFMSIDNTIGYRVTPALTIRAGHTAMRNFGQPRLDNEVGLSFFWAVRWW